jgi:Fe-Mn family superoxide dismutase
LTLEDGKLAITTTGNADLPLKHGQTALITCDVWEHAYYIDYRNKRADYVNVFLDHLLDWSKVERALTA